VKKCFFSDESQIFVQVQHIRFVRIRKGDQLSPAHFNEVIKLPRIKVLWGIFILSGVGSLMPIDDMITNTFM